MGGDDPPPPAPSELPFLRRNFGADRLFRNPRGVSLWPERPWEERPARRPHLGSVGAGAQQHRGPPDSSWAGLYVRRARIPARGPAISRHPQAGDGPEQPERPATPDVPG